jgi:hypothetical protein
MGEYSIKDKVAVVGLGETKYYKRGQAPVSEFQLACEAILKAVEDAGIEVSDLDGFASYSNDRNDAARLATALGLHHYCVGKHAVGRRRRRRAGAMAQAAAAVAGRPMPSAWWSSARWPRASSAASARRPPSRPSTATSTHHVWPYGLFVRRRNGYALRVRRFMHEHALRSGGARRGGRSRTPTITPNSTRAP